MDKHDSQTPANRAETECDIDVEDAFGQHDVIYWVREGNRLVPATPTQIAAIQEHEALLRLAVWRSDTSTRPLHIRHLRHIGRATRRWLMHSLTDHRQPRAPDMRETLPTDTRTMPSLTEAQQDAARKRSL